MDKKKTIKALYEQDTACQPHFHKPKVTMAYKDLKKINAKKYKTFQIHHNPEQSTPYVNYIEL